MTTIISDIIPTAALVKWRREHPERYHFRLSDHNSVARHSRSSSGCLRNRKAWMIEYTMYVSSQNIGTQPYRELKAQDVHKIQWLSTAANYSGRMIQCESAKLEEQLQCRRSKPSIWRIIPTYFTLKQKDNKVKNNQS
jgi:hypothetical protein